MAELLTPRTQSSGPVAAPALLPPPTVRLRVAGRVGLNTGLVAVFVSAIGMVEAFATRTVVGTLTLGYVLLVVIATMAGYLAGRPPPHREGFAPAQLGGRNLAAGLVAGVTGAAVLAAFTATASAFDLRRVFPNLSPTLVDLLTFDRGLAPGVGLVLAGGAALGAAGGAAHLLGRWRRPVTAGLTWVLLIGLLQGLVSQILRGAGVASLDRFLFAPGGGLHTGAAVVVGLIAAGAQVAVPRTRAPLQARLQALPDRQRRRAALLGLALLLLVVGVLPQILGPFLSEVLNVAGIFLLMALGLNIVVGFAGMLDLGYVAFFAVGAYTTAVLTSPASPRWAPELTLWLALPFVVLAAALAGIMVGTPVLRMRGDYLAIVTLGFGEIARLMFLSDWLKPSFGGAQGIIRVPALSVGPLTIRGPQAFVYAVLAFVLLAVYVSHALQDSRIGRAWMAMREDEPVAEAMGVNIVHAKLSAFIIGAVLASFGGALFAAKIGSVFPHSFNIIVSITVLVIIIVGGMGSLPGTVVGALVLIGLPELLREFEKFKFLVYGALLIFMMLKRPEGLLPSKQRARELHQEELMQDAWLQHGEPPKVAADAGRATDRSLVHGGE